MIIIDTSSKNIIEITQSIAAKNKRVAAKTMTELLGASIERVI